MFLCKFGKIKLMKTLLIHPPVRVEQDPQDIPRGLGYMASISMKEGHDVALLDLNVSRPKWSDVAKQIAVSKWDIIGIGGLSSMYKDILKVLYLSRKLNPNALIVCGGGFITYMPDRIMKLNPQIDVAAIGEGEETWKEIITTPDKGGLKNVKGICYKEDDQLLYTKPRPLIPDMDVIPLPAYELMDLDGYFKYSRTMWYNGLSKNDKRINFVTERGCPRQCTFCTHNGMNRWDQLALLGKEKMKMLDDEAGFQAVTRFFSPKYVVNEAIYVHEKYGVDFVALVDENLTSNNKRVHELCDLWIQEGLHKKVKLGTAGDAPSVNKEVIEHMKEAGFTWFSIGGESGSDRVLREDIGKGVTVAHNQKAVDIIKECGIQPIMTFMVGNPNEDINDVLDTVSFFIKNKIVCDPFICTPYPGTKLFMDYEEFILSQYDERLALLRESKDYSAPEETVKKWKEEALQKFLLSLNDATDYSCTVSKKFDYADLIAIKYFMAQNDTAKLLKLAHMRGWEHQPRWDDICPVCLAKKEFLEKPINN